MSRNISIPVHTQLGVLRRVECAAADVIVLPLDVAAQNTSLVGAIEMLQPLGAGSGVGGGWYATILDSALGCAVHTLMPTGHGYTTAELSVTIVRAASHATGPLRAIGTVIHCGKRLATAEGRIVGPEGKLYAHATTTCLVFELPGRG